MKHLLFCIVALLFCSAISFGQNADIKQLKKQLAHAPDSFRYTDALNALATLYYESNADSVLFYTTKARDVARRLHYADGEADAANNLGILEEIKGNAQQAFRYYADAYQRYAAMGNRPDMRQSMMNIALTYCEMENPQKALVHFKKAMALNEGLQPDSVAAVMYANYVSCFFKQLPYDSVNFYLVKAREILSKHNYKPTTLFVDELFADNLVAKHDTAQGIALLKTCLEAAYKDSLFFTATNLLADLGSTVPDSAEAAAYYLQSLKLAEAKGFRAPAKYVYEMLYDFYQAKGNDEASLLYAQKLLDFTHAQKDIDNASGIDYIDYAAMNQGLTASLQASRHQKRILWITIPACILFFILIVLLLRSRRKMKKTSLALDTQFKQLKQTTESLERINKNYSRVIKVVAHDLRNPLSSVFMVSEIIEPYKMPPREIEKLANLIKTTSKSCLDLIEKLLHTDLEGEQKPEKKDVLLDELLMQSVNLLSFSAKEKQQQIVLTNKHRLTLFADSDKIVRVLNNLLANAIKFSHEGSTIHVKAHPAANNIVITVADTGIGIPETAASRVFDPFTSVKRKGTRGENTFGLGLYISKQIVEAHNGNIWFKSEPGRGTTFFVELPVKRDYEAPGIAAINESKENL